MKITKEVSRIKVTGIDKPTVRELVVYQEFIVDHDEGGESLTPGFQYLETMLHQKVNMISDTQFEIISTGEILTRV